MRVHPSSFVLSLGCALVPGVVLAACGSFSGTEPDLDAGQQADAQGIDAPSPLEAAPPDGPRAPPECPASATLCDTFERDGTVQGSWSTRPPPTGSVSLALDRSIAWSGVGSLKASGSNGSAVLREDLSANGQLSTSFYLRMDALPAKGGSIIAQFTMTNGTAASFVVESRGFKISEQVLSAGDGGPTYFDEPPRELPLHTWVLFDFSVVQNRVTIEAAQEVPAIRMEHVLKNPVAQSKSLVFGFAYLEQQAQPVTLWFDDIIIR